MHPRPLLLATLPCALLASCIHISDKELDDRLDLDRDGFASVQFGGEDCDDADADIHPGAGELCDQVDADCDGNLDEGEDVRTWYLDVDEDGFGDRTDPGTQSCSAPAGMVEDRSDCLDTNAAVNPGMTEICEEDQPGGGNIDEDCDGVLAATSRYFRDADGDGYGDAREREDYCEAREGWVTVADDCDDTNDAINPGQEEICNTGIDEDCATDSNDACLYDVAIALDSATTIAWGMDVDARFGASLAAGDLDADGELELAIGAPGANGSLGGSTASVVILSALGEELPAEALDVSEAIVDDDPGFRIGAAIAIGNVIGDASDDLVLGTPAGDTSAGGITGAVYLLEGPISAGATLTALEAPAVLATINSGDKVGTSLALGPDLDGNATSELLIGAPGWSGDTGAAYLVYMPLAATGEQWLDDLVNDEQAVRFEGKSGGGGAGSTVAWGGDVDGDGDLEVLVGSPAHGASRGAVQVFDLPEDPDAFEYAAGDAAFDLLGTTSGDLFGTALAGGTDANRDGYDDILVGAPGCSPEAMAGAGCAYLVYGGSETLSGPDIGINTLVDAGDAMVFLGDAPGDALGSAVAFSADFDGDDRKEIVLGAPGAAAGAGEVWLYSGTPTAAAYRTDAAHIITGTASSAAGTTLLAPGNIDGEGPADLVIGGTGYLAGDEAVGAAWLLFGRSW